MRQSTQGDLFQVGDDIIHILTSSVRGFGGGGNEALSILRSFALRAPLEDFAFFPMVSLVSSFEIASAPREGTLVMQNESRNWLMYGQLDIERGTAAAPTRGRTWTLVDNLVVAMSGCEGGVRKTRTKCTYATSIT